MGRKKKLIAGAFAAGLCLALWPPTCVMAAQNESVWPDHLIWVGDSRMKGMSFTEGQDEYIAAESVGVWWLRDEALAQIRSAAGQEGTAIVLALGINDLSNAPYYIESYEDLIESFPEGMIRVLSVLPVDEDREAANGYQVRNQEIVSFNAQMETVFPEAYLDAYDYLAAAGFETADGVHYSSATYHKLNQYVHETLEEEAFEGGSSARYQRLRSEDGLIEEIVDLEELDETIPDGVDPLEPEPRKPHKVTKIPAC